MDFFYIEFYDLVFKIYADKTLFENSFYGLLKKACEKAPNYVIRFCGSIEEDCVKKYCKGETIVNYKGNRYYSFQTHQGEILKINIDSEYGAHMIKCRENIYDIYNIGKEKKEV